MACDAAPVWTGQHTKGLDGVAKVHSNHFDCLARGVFSSRSWRTFHLLTSGWKMMVGVGIHGTVGKEAGIAICCHYNMPATHQWTSIKMFLIHAAITHSHSILFGGGGAVDIEELLLTRCCHQSMFMVRWYLWYGKCCAQSSVCPQGASNMHNCASTQSFPVYLFWLNFTTVHRCIFFRSWLMQFLCWDLSGPQDQLFCCILCTV